MLKIDVVIFGPTLTQLVRLLELEKQLLLMFLLFFKGGNIVTIIRDLLVYYELVTNKSAYRTNCIVTILLLHKFTKNIKLIVKL